ncbi:alpha/beta hydrolase [Labrys monachus]|uniref:Acetyl esterase/lipase n=1 Tax=Labrys monachus TaxID=217067 RepID=A0ABU0FB10_9HYPH|nr:alpha/beta hydrolase [Labrys monachus]MDQ0391790.1 acetyl esterase/lipase [Labrys monachus]
MTDASGIDWEDAFSNGAYIPGGEGYPARWAADALAFRQAVRGLQDIAYGDQPRERFDLFLPDGVARGLAVIIHGGYWLSFDKSSWSALAAGALAQGWAVALPGYTLAPAARIGAITRQVGRAIEAAAARVPGPIRLTGHSAGGHLAARMVCNDTPLTPDTAARVDRLVSISGLHDLRPLRLNGMNDTLRLDAAEAETESPVLHAPLPGVDVTAWVGARERPEFLRQSALLAEAWGRQGAQTRLVADPRRHHFDVIDGLKEPDHPLTLAFVGDCVAPQPLPPG